MTTHRKAYMRKWAILSRPVNDGTDDVPLPKERQDISTNVNNDSGYFLRTTTILFMKHTLLLQQQSTDGIFGQKSYTLPETDNCLQCVVINQITIFKKYLLNI